MPPLTAVRKRSRATRPKTKTFTGCWTCRSRKVKCDCTRPVCHRCVKGGFACQGFGLQLHWVGDGDANANAEASFNVKRRAMLMQGFERWSFDSEELETQLALVEAQDGMQLRASTFSTGPFGVFSNYKSAGDCDLSVSRDKSSSLSVQGVVDVLISSGTLQKMERPLSMDLVQSLFNEPIIGILLKNYVENVTCVLPPIPHPENPHLSIYVPKALDGASVVLLGLNSPSAEQSSSNVAIFYASLATSAFHLRGTEGGAAMDYDLLGRRFRAEAFTAVQDTLKEHLESEDAVSQFSPRIAPSSSSVEAVMSAMLTLITMDIMEGSMSEYWIHLEGFHRFAEHCPNGPDLSPRVERLRAISAFLSTIAESTNVDLPALCWTDEAVDNPYSNHQHNIPVEGLELAYGLTATLAALMQKTITLSRYTSGYATEALDLPTSLTSACRSLLLEITNWSLDTESLDHLFDIPGGSTVEQITRHHIMAFATALKVFYHVRILPCSPKDTRSHVAEVGYHLLKIEELKRDGGYKPHTFATIMWPGFIAACEAERGSDRDMWYRWWTGMLEYRIGNISELWKIVQASWSSRDEGSLEVPAWMPVLKHSSQRILVV